MGLADRDDVRFVAPLSVASWCFVGAIREGACGANVDVDVDVDVVPPPRYVVTATAIKTTSITITSAALTTLERLTPRK
jgi:hypothetical protein